MNRHKCFVIALLALLALGWMAAPAAAQQPRSRASRMCAPSWRAPAKKNWPKGSSLHSPSRSSLSATIRPRGSAATPASPSPASARPFARWSCSTLAA